MAKYRIQYVDSTGQQTERVVQPLEGPSAFEGAFDAFCERAQENRSFKWARIRGAVDLATGECLDAAAFLARLRPGAQAAPNAYRLKAAPLARALVAFSRDVVGKFDLKRKKIIAQELLAFLGNEAPPLDQLVEYLGTGIPDPQRLYEGAAALADELNARELGFARNAAQRLLAGSGRIPVAADRLKQVAEIFGA